MKYLKSLKEELDAKKALLGTAIAAGLLTGSCKKEDIAPINKDVDKIEVVKDSTDDNETKVDLKKIADKVSDLTKTSKVKDQKPKKKKIVKFKDYLPKFKKEPKENTLAKNIEQNPNVK